MNMQHIIDTVREFDGALVVAPEAGSAFPEIAWGDAYFYYAPDGRMPERTQPYGTIVTKNYPDDTSSLLDHPERFRVNVHVGNDRADILVPESADPSQTDTLFRHPLYGAAGWICAINPGEATTDAVLELLREAHDRARARAARRRR